MRCVLQTKEHFRLGAADAGRAIAARCEQDAAQQRDFGCIDRAGVEHIAAARRPATACHRALNLAQRIGLERGRRIDRLFQDLDEAFELGGGFDSTIGVDPRDQPIGLGRIDIADGRLLAHDIGRHGLDKKIDPFGGRIGDDVIHRKDQLDLGRADNAIGPNLLPHRHNIVGCQHRASLHGRNPVDHRQSHALSSQHRIPPKNSEKAFTRP